MITPRILAGRSCLAVAFVIVVLLASGTVDAPGASAARSPAELVAAYLPLLGGAVVLFVIGLLLIRKRGAP